MELSKNDTEELRRVLLHCIGDTRLCPICQNGSILKDITADETHNLYDKLFKNKENL